MSHNISFCYHFNDLSIMGNALGIIGALLRDLLSN